jgi:guanylate kinase
LLAADEKLHLSISVTTRAPREGELDGQHYHFIDQKLFDAMVAAHQLLEYAQVFGRSYGTPRAPVESALADGQDILFDIDWQGFRQLRSALGPDVVGVFIKPPSLAELRLRLVSRGDDAAQVERRMSLAEAELSHAGEFDYIVENADFETALEDLRAILRSSRLATFRHNFAR